MMIAFFFIKIFLNKSSEILNLICIFTGSFFTKVSNGFYTLKPNLIKNFYYIVLNEIKVAA